jgi:hypothetical protein
MVKVTQHDGFTSLLLLIFQSSRPIIWVPNQPPKFQQTNLPIQSSIQTHFQSNSFGSVQTQFQSNSILSVQFRLILPSNWVFSVFSLRLVFQCQTESFQKKLFRKSQNPKNLAKLTLFRAVRRIFIFAYWKFGALKTTKFSSLWGGILNILRTRPLLVSSFYSCLNPPPVRIRVWRRASQNCATGILPYVSGQLDAMYARRIHGFGRHFFYTGKLYNRFYTASFRIGHS